MPELRILDDLDPQAIEATHPVDDEGQVMTARPDLGKRNYSVEAFLSQSRGALPMTLKRVGHDFPTIEEARSWCARKLSADQRIKGFDITEWTNATSARVATGHWYVDRSTFGLPER